MARATILLMDSFGIGASADAADFGDAGANTFGHIAQACTAGQANIPEVRQGPLDIPELTKLGLYQATKASCGHSFYRGENPLPPPTAHYGYAIEQSRGKDTPSGHWELAGVPVTFDWGYFHGDNPCFPEALTQALIQQGQLPGILGNKHASGTEIIEELGEEHRQTGKPIVYTSADSVFQIAAHEKHFGLDRLYQLCQIARTLVDDYNVGRVIARPFIGEPGNYQRTANRRDLATPPPAPTLLDKLKDNQREVIAIGKIADIYAHNGITQTIKAANNMALFDATLEAMASAPQGSLIFTNFVDFDSAFGHRRNVSGYAAAIEAFDKRLVEFQQKMQPDDIAIITADHGCDPTQPGSDHTREHIPVLAFGPKLLGKDIGARKSFADVGQSIASYLHIPPLQHGTSFL